LHNIYTASKALQYDFALATTGYLDIPATVEYAERVEADPSEDNGANGKRMAPARSPDDPPFIPRYRASRGTINVELLPTVVLHKPRGANNDAGPSTRRPPFGPGSSPLDKTHHLQRQETSWESLTPQVKRVMSIKGQQGVYELQEGIFLMCDDYRSTNGITSKVSAQDMALHMYADTAAICDPHCPAP
jgi:hypothetical protein